MTPAQLVTINDLLEEVYQQLTVAGIDYELSSYIVGHARDKLSEEHYANAMIEPDELDQTVRDVRHWTEHSLKHKRYEAAMERTDALREACEQAAPVLASWRTNPA